MYFYCISNFNDKASLKTFNKKVNDKNEVQLNWVTATEMNNDFFAVEQSLNAIQWNEIAPKVRPVISSTDHTYSIDTGFPKSLVVNLGRFGDEIGRSENLVANT